MPWPVLEIKLQALLNLHPLQRCGLPKRLPFTSATVFANLSIFDFIQTMACRFVHCKTFEPHFTVMTLGQTKILPSFQPAIQTRLHHLLLYIKLLVLEPTLKYILLSI